MQNYNPFPENNPSDELERREKRGEEERKKAGKAKNQSRGWKVVSMADCETIKPLSQWLCGELRWAFCVLIHLSVGVSCCPKSTGHPNPNLFKLSIHDLIHGTWRWVSHVPCMYSSGVNVWSVILPRVPRCDSCYYAVVYINTNNNNWS